MRSSFSLLVMTGALALALPALAAEPARNKPTIVLQEDISDLPGKQFVLLHNDYVPGAVSPLHRHNGDQWSVVELGEVAISVNGEPEKTYKVGDRLHIPAGVPHSGVNHGSTPARVMEMFVIEKGKPLLDFIPAPPK
jgi:quercetin dioxygenase-like cupin family protein